MMDEAVLAMWMIENFDEDSKSSTKERVRESVEQIFDKYTSDQEKLDALASIVSAMRNEYGD